MPERSPALKEQFPTRVPIREDGRNDPLKIAGL